jgi:methenyltetrahydrofolate cyclohydrolase
VDLDEIQKRPVAVMDKFKALLEDDANAFYPLSQAYGFKEETDEEKRYKAELLQASLYQTAAMPYEIFECYIRRLCYIKILLKKVLKIAMSDTGQASCSVWRHPKGLKLNVLINTKIMKDKSLKAQYEGKVDELVSTGTIEADLIFQRIEAELRK